MKKLVLAFCILLGLASNASAFVLDSITAPITAAYSVRQLKTGVTLIMRFVCGNSSQQDAGISGGFVDLTVCAGAGGIASIAKIYDQSGGSNDLAFTAGTATNCSITASGIGSHPSINFTSSCLYESVNVTQTPAYTVLGVVQSSSTTQPQLIFSADKVGTLREAHYLRFDGGPPANALTLIAFNNTGTPFSGTQSTTVSGVAHTISSIMAAGPCACAISTWVDTVAGTPGSMGAGNTPAQSPPSIPLDLGGDNTNASSFLGLWSETILLGAANTTDRSNIEADERTTFGFVTTAGGSIRSLIGVGK